MVNKFNALLKDALQSLEVKSTFSSHLSRKHASAIDQKVSTDLLIEEPDSSRNCSDNLIHDNAGNVEINDEFGCLSECDQDEPNSEADFNEVLKKPCRLLFRIDSKTSNASYHHTNDHK